MGRDMRVIWGVSPNVVTYSAAMRACLRSGEWRLALAFIDQMRGEALQLSEVTYLSAAQACETGGNWQGVLEVLRESQQFGVPRLLATYNSALAALGRARQWRHAAALLFSMRRQPGADEFAAEMPADVV